MRIPGERCVGARRIVTLTPEAAPDLRLRLDMDRDAPAGPDRGLVLRDGRVIGPA